MKKISLSIAFLMIGVIAFAQQALFGGSQLVSPEIHPDNTVTFRLLAPKAVKVQITGDFLPKAKMQTERGLIDIPGTTDLVEKEKKKSGGTTSEEIYDVKMPATRLAVKFPAFCFLIMTFLGIVAMVMTSTYGVYMYDSYINDMVTASYFVSIRTAVSMVLSFLFGILCDKLGLRASVLIYGLLCAASSFIGPVIGGTAGALILACFNGTMAYTTMFIGVGLPLVVGYKNMPAFAGWAGSLMSVGGMNTTDTTVNILIILLCCRLTSPRNVSCR